MGLINTRAFIENANIDFMNLVEDTSIGVNEYGSLVQVALENAADSETNWNRIMEACYCNELNYFAENGEEYVYTEASAGGFIQAAKDFFKKIWEKIKELFRKFGMMISQFGKDDKAFVKKYRTDIVKKMAELGSDVEYKGYKFTHFADYVAKVNEVAGDKTNLLERAASYAENIGSNTAKPTDNYELEDELEKTRGKVLGQSTALTASEFPKELFMYFRDGESAKDTLPVNSQTVNEAMQELEANAETRRIANRAFTDVTSYFSKIDKALTNAATKLSKDFTKDTAKVEGETNRLVHLQREIAENKGFTTISQVAHAAMLTALKDRSRQYKALCVKVAMYKRPKNESYSFNHYGEGASFLDGIVLI